MIERMEQSLEGKVCKVWNVACCCDKEGRSPIYGSRAEGLDQYVEGVSRYDRRQQSVAKEKEVPGDDASPHEEMLNPSEVAHSEGDLRVNNPDDAGEHGGPHGTHVGSLPIRTECLGMEDADGDEEYYEG